MSAGTKTASTLSKESKRLYGALLVMFFVLHRIFGATWVTDAASLGFFVLVLIAMT